MPDPTFGDDGFSFIGPPPPDVYIGSAHGLTIDRNARILVTGRGGPDNGGQFFAARVMPNGSPDESFGQGGLALTDYYGALNAIAVGTAAIVQSSGKIVVTGREGVNHLVPRRNNMVLGRFNHDGSIDYAFSGGKDAGWRTNYRAYTGNAIIRVAGGRFVVASTGSGNKVGWADYGLLNRYFANGAADPTFNGGVSRRRSGQIKVAAGIHRSIMLEDVTPIGRGRILIAGNLGGRFMVARLRWNGTYDRSFGRRGVATFDVDGRGACRCRTQAYGLARTASGQILVAGQTNRRGTDRPYLVLARFTPNGRRDRSFGKNGIARLRLPEKGIAGYDVAVQKDGRIVVAGQAGRYMAAVRFLPNGRLDRSFFQNGLYRDKVLGGMTGARKVMIDKAGRIVIAGGDDYTRYAFVLRLLPNAGR